MDTRTPTQTERTEALKLACKQAGGEAKLAEAIGKTRSHISTWKFRGMIPAEMAIPIEAASGVSRHVLRPDLYPAVEAAE
jgi:DNA-binding transcriptional regulator YdaS (Cro superfamily)